MADTTVRAGQILTADALNAITMSVGRRLERITLVDNSATVNFGDIDQGFTNLRIIATGGFTGSSNHFAAFQLNGDDSDSYNWFSSHRFDNFTWGQEAREGANAATVGLFGFGALQSTTDVLIPDYAQAHFHTMHAVYSGDATGQQNRFSGQAVAVHNRSQTVQQIEVQGGSGAVFLAGSTFTLYGLP